MNELQTVCHQIQHSTPQDTEANAKAIYALCRSVTPQFYKTDNMATTVASIALLIGGIEPELLSTMCKLAVGGYPKERSKNERTHFDIDYVLTWYGKAQDHIHRCMLDYGLDTPLLPAWVRSADYGDRTDFDPTKPYYIDYAWDLDEASRILGVAVARFNLPKGEGK